MSVHPSLISKGKGKRFRSVLKRFERLKELLEKEKWPQGRSIFGLPKVKTLRWKVKKAKKAAEAAQPATAAEGADKTSTPQAKDDKTQKK